MKWTDEMLSQIEELGKIQFAPRQVAIVMGIPELELLEMLEEQDSPVHQAYWKGRLQEEAEQRKAVLELAKGGSAAAQALAKQFMDEAKVGE